MPDIPIEKLKKNLTGGGGEVFYPLTTTEAVEDENGKALDLILTDVMGSMGDAFSETASYEVGDYCIYQDVLYKFIAAKSAGAWDVNAVSKTTIDAELKSLFNQVSELNSDKPILKAGIGTTDHNGDILVGLDGSVFITSESVAPYYTQTNFNGENWFIHVTDSHGQPIVTQELAWSCFYIKAS